MGLYVSHGAWIGSYGAFMAWRKRIAQVAGLPPLELMEGFYTSLEAHFEKPIDENRRIFAFDVPTLWTSEKPNHLFLDLDSKLPIKWESLKPSPLYLLLNHCDCGGEISWKKCGKIADCLEPLIELLPEEEGEDNYSWNWKEKTRKFVDGLRLAHKLKENLVFS